MTDQELKTLCKDEASFQKLKSYLHALNGEKAQVDENLRLLEEAIKGDYDSILITELDLEKPGPRIVYVNDGFTRMTGYRREEVIGKTPRILQGPKTDRATLDRLKRCLIEGKSFFGQAVNYRKDGSEFINQWDIHPIYNNEGEITHWVSYQHDISARKKAELTFLENDVEFDELYEYSKRTLVDINRKGELAMANKSFRELFGITNDEIKNMRAWDLFPTQYQDRVKAEFDLLWEESDRLKSNQRLVARATTGELIQLEVEPKLLALSSESLMRFNIKNLSLQKKVVKTLTRRNRQFDSIFSKVGD